MTTHVCPRRITRLFEGGRAPEAQKGRARALAVAWLKSQTPNMRPLDTVMMPNPDTGELEPFMGGAGATH